MKKQKIENSRQFTLKHNGYRLYLIPNISFEYRKLNQENLKCSICNKRRVRYIVTGKFSFEMWEKFDDYSMCAEENGDIELCDRIECLEEFQKALILIKLIGRK